MAINKVKYGNQTLIDLSTDTVSSAEHILLGKVGHLRDGTVVTGTASGGDPHGTIWQDGNGNVHLDDESGIALQSKSVTPSESQQIVEAGEGYYALDKVTVGAISSSYVGSGVTRRSSSDLTASGATVTAPAGYYSSSASKAVATGTAGTPTATKGTVSNHAVTVTPSVTNTTGYISGGTKTGTGISVSASELVSGTKTITENGTGIDVSTYSSVDVAVSSALEVRMTVGGSDPNITLTPNKTFAEAKSVLDAGGELRILDSNGNALECTYQYYPSTNPPKILLSYYRVKPNLDQYSYVYYYNWTSTGIAYIAHEVMVEEPTLITKNITANGTYNASSDSADGYSSVTVNVSGGGGEEVSMDDPVRFFDYDGTLVHSYSASDFQALTAMPSNPSHSGLTAQGWNWTLADAKAQVTAMGACDIGQMYVTDDGKTRLYCHFEEGRLAPYLAVCPNGTVTIDWGDNSSTDTLTGTSITARKSVQHVYASPGDYVITITATSGTFGFYGSSGYYILFKQAGSSQYYSRVYTNSITKIELGTGVTSLSNYSFSNCHSLETITIPNNVTVIGQYAFDCCYSLQGIVIPNGITSISQYTFQQCNLLQHIVLPKSISSLGSYALGNCYSLSSITIPSSGTSISTYAFYYCRSLIGIIMPSAMTSISSRTFFGCESLRGIAIPSNVTSINDYSFYGCYSLAVIEIPSGVTSIGANTFANCYGLAEIHFKPTTPPTVSNSNAWTNLQTDCKIYVPTGTLSAYTSAANYPSSATYTYIEE